MLNDLRTALKGRKTNLIGVAVAAIVAVTLIWPGGWIATHTAEILTIATALGVPAFKAGLERALSSK